MTTTTALDATTSFLLERVGMTDKIAETAARLVELAQEYDRHQQTRDKLANKAVDRTRALLRQAHIEDELGDVVRDLPDADEGPFRLEYAGEVILCAADGGELVLGSSR